MVTIQSKDFTLRYFRLSDAQGYFECQQDNEARKNFMSIVSSVEEARSEVKKIISEYKKKKPQKEFFAITVDGKFAGYVSLSDLNKKFFEHKAVIGYGMHPGYRGRGITTKAVKLVTAYAFKKYSLKRIEGWCRTFNKASSRVLEKSGYKLEGVLRKNKFKDGKFLNDMVWARVK
jgi:[ribosomal protein S5]-alanine N-acetyltransferase